MHRRHLISNKNDIAVLLLCNHHRRIYNKISFTSPNCSKIPQGKWAHIHEAYLQWRGGPLSYRNRHQNCTLTNLHNKSLIFRTTPWMYIYIYSNTVFSHINTFSWYFKYKNVWCFYDEYLSFVINIVTECVNTVYKYSSYHAYLFARCSQGCCEDSVAFVDATKQLSTDKVWYAHVHMMTSSLINIFRVTGHLWG